MGVKELFFALLHFGINKGMVEISLDMAKSIQGRIVRLIMETRKRVAQGMVGRRLGWGGKEMEKGMYLKMFHSHTADMVSK